MTTYAELTQQIIDYTETDSNVLTTTILNDIIEHAESRIFRNVDLDIAGFCKRRSYLHRFGFARRGRPSPQARAWEHRVGGDQRDRRALVPRSSRRRAVGRRRDPRGDGDPSRRRGAQIHGRADEGVRQGLGRETGPADHVRGARRRRDRRHDRLRRRDRPGQRLVPVPWVRQVFGRRSRAR